MVEPLTVQEEVKPLPGFGKRHIVVLLGFLGFFMIYALRVNLSVAIVSMVKYKPSSPESNLSTICKEKYTQMNEGSGETVNEGDFDWDPHIQSIILGSFFWGYILTQVPGGRLAEKYGSKNVLACSVGVTSLLTLLSPPAARMGHHWFIAVRVVEGLFEGVAFPAMHLMIGKWIPKSERGFLATAIYSGTQIGTVVTMATAGFLCASGFLGGWPSVFYVFGILGILWVIAWMMIIHDKPEAHPSISMAELEHIKRENKENVQRQVPKTPWKSILTSIPVWALVITHFGQNWGFYTLLYELPTYFSTILGFNIKKNGLLSALPYLLQATGGWISSYCFDLMIKKKRLKANTVRKLSNTVAFLGPALCLFGVTLAKCDPLLNVILFSLAMGVNGLYLCGFHVTHVDMAPDFAGTLMGITNCVANFTGILAPYVVGVVTKKENSIHTWAYVFYICMSVYCSSALIFIVFGSARRQKWSTVKAEASNE